MKQKNGKNISKQFLQTILLSKETANQINSIINESLINGIDLIKKSSNIKEVLNNELFMLQNFDINHYSKNEKKINNLVTYCNMAIEEYDLFNNKKIYFNKVCQRNMFSSKEIDIKRDTVFEKSVKKLIINLGKEKRVDYILPQLVELYEVRIDKLKEICKEFTKERIAFMSKHINQENTNK